MLFVSFTWEACQSSVSEKLMPEATKDDNSVTEKSTCICSAQIVFIVEHGVLVHLVIPMRNKTLKCCSNNFTGKSSITHPIKLIPHFSGFETMLVPQNKLFLMELRF